MDCSYCSTGAIEGRLIRKLPPEEAAAELFRYKNAGFARFFFVDNTFNLPPSYAEALCDAIISRGLSISWRCIVYPWKITKRLAAKMAAAGCVEVSLGFESGCCPVLRRLNKHFRAADAARAASHFRACGISRMGFLLLGGPGETRHTVQTSLAWADSLELDTMKLTTGIRIYPETALAAAAVSEGITAPDDNLFFPRFYIRPELEGWLQETVGRWAEKRPGWFFQTP
ncbi:MAG TPA: radical SAM protein [Desulfosalsimonadaceae bacterium]|nr:radical SAM protein [Desulfosalsimonadaceae bacterium]